MLVSASVSESDIGPIAPDQEATFTVDAYPAKPFHGRVAQVRNAPVAVQNVVTYDVLVGVDNAELRLKPGMTANITITTASLPDVLRVPTSALRFRPPGVAYSGARGDGVWTLDDGGSPRFVPVAIGIADDVFTEVTGGIAAGDRVLTGIERTVETARGGGPSFSPGVPRRGFR